MGLIADTKVDFGQMMSFKQEAIDGNTKGIDFLFKKNKVEVIRGTARSSRRQGRGRRQDHDAQNTSSSPRALTSAKLRGVEIDEKQIVTSTGALDAGEDPGASRGRSAQASSALNWARSMPALAPRSR